ncbi:hypothetical protein [Kitasatospora purpeofusca]|uniref:hypothetical protein n=1 Tax=Kitasatospora purpeofusca TaxID=67352 RepID=UPI003830CA2F
MSDHSSPRRPLAQPFSHPHGALDEPLAERLLPAERLASPFSTTAPAPAARDGAGGGRRPLGHGALACTADPAGD